MSKSETYGLVTVSAPEGWTLEFHRECVNYSTREYANDLDQPIFKRKGIFAGRCTNYESVHEIELRSHYNGGGPAAFGGAKQWPVVTTKIAFNEGEYSFAAEFAEDLGRFIDRWLEKRGGR